ncbi:MAG: dephospho-CoA kinase [Acholeplasmatales bacterium]|nr:dephospho-CoA kinase [Acholeplasmatales bacterium]
MTNVKNRPYLIALTGGIASGKSTASHYLAKNYYLIDSDQIVANFYENPDFLSLLDREFATHDKIALRNLIFKQHDNLVKLNSLVHPLVKKEIEKLIVLHNSEKIIIIDIPLLFEIGWENNFDCNILISCSLNKQLTRLMQRNNLSLAEATRWLALQKPMKEKRKVADYIIHNNYSPAYLEHRLDTTIADIFKNLI